MASDTAPITYLTEQVISSRVWTFGLAGGDLFARNVVLCENGRFLHYNSPNEASWRVEDGVLVILTRDGSPSCRMVPVPGPDPQRLWLEGEHIIGGNTGIQLALRETEILYPVHLLWSTAHEDFAEQVPFYLSSGFRVRGIYRSGQSIVIPAPALVEPQACLPHGSFISVGAYSYCNGSFNSMSKASIGRYCSISGGAQPFGPSHPMERVSTSVFSYDSHYIGIAKLYGCDDYEVTPYDQSGEPVRIEHDVWIGEDAMIRGGVTIGTGSVIAARCIVTRDVPPYAIMTGMPGRVLRSRFPTALVDRLLASHWWEYNFFDLPRSATDPERFVTELERMQQEGSITPWQPRKIDLAEALLRIAPTEF